MYKKVDSFKKVDFTCFKILAVFLFHHMRYFLWNDPFSYAIVSITEVYNLSSIYKHIFAFSSNLIHVVMAIEKFIF